MLDLNKFSGTSSKRVLHSSGLSESHHGTSSGRRQPHSRLNESERQRIGGYGRSRLIQRDATENTYSDRRQAANSSRSARADDNSKQAFNARGRQHAPIILKKMQNERRMSEPPIRHNPYA